MHVALCSDACQDATAAVEAELPPVLDHKPVSVPLSAPHAPNPEPPADDGFSAQVQEMSRQVAKRLAQVR